MKGACATHRSKQQLLPQSVAVSCSRLQPQPLHDHGADERRLGHVPVEPGERTLVHPFVQHGLRPDSRRDVLVFAWGLIRHSDVHGYAEVRPTTHGTLWPGEHVCELSGFTP